jgi:hypothetical protein
LSLSASIAEIHCSASQTTKEVIATMNVFLSWSGALSHDVAKALVAWIPQVIQAVKPWISSQDIEKGARWFEEIGESLSSTDFGVLCLTASNLSAPWILFEAGALSKSLGQARVCPLLVNVKNADLTGPLAQFNTSGIGKEEIRRLVGTLNSRLPAEQRRSDIQLDEAFQVWWPRLEGKIAEAIAVSRETEVNERSVPKRKLDDVLDEILELTRLSAHQLSRLEIDTSASPQRPNYPRNSVGELAQELNRSPETLLEQLASAGVKKVGPGAHLTEADKEKLLDYLRASHGTTVGDRKKITLTRRTRDT